MEITKTLLINAACLLIPPVVVVLLLRHFFPRKIRWSAGVVALVDLVIFWTDISYYESCLADAVFCCNSVSNGFAYIYPAL